jgi:RES domain-containing protein
MIYCADTRALAVLETLVRAAKDQIPSDYVFYEVDLDDDLIQRLRDEDIPSDWATTEPPTREHSEQNGCEARNSAALLVPSVVIREERNLLLNPEHPEFTAVRVSGPQFFQFDRRLFR